MTGEGLQMNLKKIILVFKTHFDIGFTDLASNVTGRYAKEMLEEVIETCKKTQDMGKLRYVWTMPSWPLMYMVKNCEPHLREQLDELIGNGQVVWHALPFTTHTDFVSQKEYLEGLKYSRQLAELYHKPCPVSAKMTDVPGHSVMLPDLLSQAGIRFLHLGCNEFATPPAVPNLFFWQAPGGRKVLTMYSKGGYGTGLVPPADWKYPVWMALMHTHDNKGPQSAEAIRKMAGQIRELYPDTEVVCGTMDDFYRELAQCNLDDLPVIKKDMADTWIHGVGAYPKETALIRRTRERMKGLQSLLFGKWMTDSFSEEICEILDNYYDEVALFEEHTWGADVKTWMGPDRVYEKRAFLEEKQSEAYRFMEASWEEQRQRAYRTLEMLETLEKLAEPSEGNRKDRRFLFQGNCASYTGWVKLPAEWDGCPVSLSGRTLPCDRIAGCWCCYVTNLPPFTSVQLERQISLYPETVPNSVFAASEKEDILTVENHRYCLRFCIKNGEILSLQDKKLKTVLLEKNENGSVFSYQYDKYGYDDINEYLRKYGYHFTSWGIQDYGRENYPFCAHETFRQEFDGYELEGHTLRIFYRSCKRIEAESGSEYGKSAAQYGDAIRIQLEITLPAAGDDIFVILYLKKKQESPYVESGSLLLPFGHKKMSWRMQKGGVLLDPQKDITEKANHSLYCLEEGMAAFEENAGICLKTPDASLVSIKGTGIYHFAPEFEETEEPCLYVNLFNNMWGTNFPQWIGGDFCFQFILSGLQNQDELLQLLTTTQEAVCVTHNFISECGIRLPEDMQLIGIDPVGDEIFVQLSDISGRSSDRSFQAEGCDITPVDLYGRTQGDTTADMCRFSAAAYGIQNFRLKKRKYGKI